MSPRSQTLRPQILRPLTAAAALLALAALSGCGKAGALERPGPLFGPTHKGPVSETEGVQDPSRPVRTIDPRRGGIGDDATNPAPARSLPIQGQNPTATEAGPPGLLPDPQHNPQ